MTRTSQLALLPESLKERGTKALLHRSILRKRAYLKAIVLKTETLKMKLDMVKQEYMVKIGSLVLKDSHLDLEIIHLRNLLELINEGLTYEEAKERLKETFYADQIRIEQEQEQIREQEHLFHKRTDITPELLIDTKKVWRRLIALFHPDLVQDTDEKKRRTEIMKQINTAYAQGDFNTLVKIENEFTVNKNTAVPKLEDVLIQLENEILHQEALYKELRESEWYRWEIKITKTKKPLEDIFADVEKTLVSDILAKTEIISELKKHFSTT